MEQGSHPVNPEQARGIQRERGSALLIALLMMTVLSLTSVIFLMTMPYLIVGTLGGWMYLAARRQRAASPAETSDAVEPEGDDT